MKQNGYADLPLHYGHIPLWLAERMGKLGLAITEQILSNRGKSDFLARMSDPFWFQSLGTVMGMDWHSSGITTSVMGTLKRVVNPLTKELGIYICGGKGNSSRQTPAELKKYANSNNLDDNHLVRCSKLVAKVDNTAIQDGFQLYQHHFVVSNEGDWTVIQQGMSNARSTARRYHWHSSSIESFTEAPHTGIVGENQGKILNLTDKQAAPSKKAILSITSENPDRMLREIKTLVMPKHHDIKAKDIDMKRLGSILWLAQEKEIVNFEELLLLEGLGPRTLQSLALVSEVIYGSPSRFTDPARFSFAHGGKDGHPFPVPIKIYDETIDIFRDAISRAKLGDNEKSIAIRSLSEIAKKAETGFIPNQNFNQLLEKERKDSWKHGGKTVYGDATPPKSKQLQLF